MTLMSGSGRKVTLILILVTASSGNFLLTALGDEGEEYLAVIGFLIACVNSL
jgi:hypothetical protein